MKRLSVILAISLLVTILIVGVGLWYIWQVKQPMTFFDYFVLDMVFLPLQVILVSVIVERLLHEREKQAMLKKLNMVIGAFFSEVGTKLLQDIVVFCDDSSELEKHLNISTDWNNSDFKSASNFLRTCQYSINPDVSQFEELHEFLKRNTIFVLKLMQNPNLLEHETFTDLLWAVTHLDEELRARDAFTGLPETDINHLKGDILRTYELLIREWLAYMAHLKDEYPYIYSLAVRTNPFKKETSVIIE